ncbi:integrase core domain-containing protein [Amycolatopsis solani]|uniref:integrase core domain-containing protein n=1 Tax=Amycolatopsis solani TaxID=3028615 RepID=UPI0025AF2C9A|nr:integrase core domain-containing protein [Amycolatopsis sp. MEP2-6]
MPLDEHRSIERSHRIDAEEFYRLLDGIVLGDIGAFNDKLKDWEDYYNYHRPHGGLAGQTPYERLLQKTQCGVAGRDGLHRSSASDVIAAQHRPTWITGVLLPLVVDTLGWGSRDESVGNVIA